MPVFLLMVLKLLFALVLFCFLFFVFEFSWWDERRVEEVEGRKEGARGRGKGQEKEKQTGSAMSTDAMIKLARESKEWNQTEW